MTKHTAVIGAGFGDEGKGHIVDCLAASGHFTRVVRFNGGSQAGHTVETADGKRFVFSQLGSGSVMGLPTHLSRFMYIDPIAFLNEVAAFEKKFGCKPPMVTVSPMARIILPSDVVDGRAHAKDTKHGSTGHGVFAAVRRSYNLNDALTYADIKHGDYNVLLSFLERFEGLDTTNVLAKFTTFVSMTSELDDLAATEVPCIFEGAQGLLLDKDSGFFPYVTPSNTGTKNVSLLLSSPIDSLNVIYVTRTFLTRHGPGPMYYDDTIEEETPPEAIPEDVTNSWNEWQGSFRTAPICLEQLSTAIQKDWSELLYSTQVDTLEATLAVTWANIRVKDILGGSSLRAIHEEEYVLPPVLIESHGKTRLDCVFKVIDKEEYSPYRA